MSLEYGKWTARWVKWLNPQDKSFLSKCFRKDRPYVWVFDQGDVSLEVVWYYSVNEWELFQIKGMSRISIWASSARHPIMVSSVKAAVHELLSEEAYKCRNFLKTFDSMFEEDKV